MDKKVMNLRLAAAAVVLLFGLLLAGQEAAAVGYDDATPTTKATAGGAAEATPTTPSDGYGESASKAAPTTEAAEAKTTPSYGKAATKGECEVPGTCDVKAVDPTRPGAVANAYTRGCNKLLGCRD